jgi:hypothetical protein
LAAIGVGINYAWHAISENTTEVNGFLNETLPVDVQFIAENGEILGGAVLPEGYPQGDLLGLISHLSE